MSYSRIAVILIAVAALSLAGCDEPAKPTINLYRAVHIGDLAQIKRHLFWRTDINQPDTDGNYPLHVAVAQGQVPIARLLIRHGADLAVTDTAGRTPLHVALANGKIPAARLLLERGADDDLQALLYALVDVGAADRDTLAWLIANGVEIDAPGADGRPPLHRAVAADDVRLAKRLITAGASVNLATADGTTPLALAQSLAERRPGGAPAMITLLTQFGAEP